MAEFFLLVAEIAAGIMAITSCIVLLIKPIRQHIFLDKASIDAQKCLLRNEILRIYYANKATETMRQYEAQNLELMYATYKKLKGNSFVDRIYRETQEWKVVA
jgi:hypothetical protein